MDAEGRRGRLAVEMMMMPTIIRGSSSSRSSRARVEHSEKGLLLSGTGALMILAAIAALCVNVVAAEGLGSEGTARRSLLQGEAAAVECDEECQKWVRTTQPLIPSLEMGCASSIRAHFRIIINKT